MMAHLALARSDDTRLRPQIIDELASLELDDLSREQRLKLLRCFDVAMTRLSQFPPEKSIDHEQARRY